MTTAFLDNSVVLGYCFTVHRFHPECESYIEQSGVDPYITQDINRIYEHKTADLIKEYSTDILQHQANLKRGDFPDQLGPTDIRDARRMIHQQNSARRFLLNWYDNEVPQFINKYELTERLRSLAEDIEQNASDKKAEFDRKVNLWDRDDKYQSVQEELEEIRQEKEEDMWVCIDAHDLAVKTSNSTTELATCDISDFIRNGRRDLILQATQIDDVVGLQD